MKECADIYFPPLTKLISLSLLERHVPDGLKSAVITPLIIKSTLPVDGLKNYCPVSDRSFLSNLVERLGARKLLDHNHDHYQDNLYQSFYKKTLN